MAVSLVISFGGWFAGINTAPWYCAGWPEYFGPGQGHARYCAPLYETEIPIRFEAVI